jgi:mannosyltransferase OCH1-like enzyme
MIKRIFKLFLFCTWTIIISVFFFLIYLGFYSYQNLLLIKKRTADANLILTGNKITNCINEACPINGCTTQKNWEDAYYKMFGTKTSCAVAIYKTKPEYLKNKVPYPRHKKCYKRFNQNFFQQEGINYKDLKSKYLSSTKLPKVIKSEIFRIPPKLNFVWFTSEKEFKTKKNHFFKINAYIFHNTKITPHWEHTLWTNNIDWITPLVKKKLEAKNIQLRSIDELDIKNLKDEALKSLSKTYAKQHSWGLASDIARDLVEYYEGGVYVDGDYKILKPTELENYMKSYKSFFGINDFNNDQDFFEIINAFMASEQRGKVLRKKLDLDYRNTIDIVNAPDYIKYPCNITQETLFKTGPIALTVAFDLKKDNSDTLIPYCSLFAMPNSYFTCFNKQKFGKHAFHGSWASCLPRELIY